MLSEPKFLLPEPDSSAAAVPADSPVTAQVGITRVISQALSDEIHLPAVIRFSVLTPRRVLSGMR